MIPSQASTGGRTSGAFWHLFRDPFLCLSPSWFWWLYSFSSYCWANPIFDTKFLNLFQPKMPTRLPALPFQLLAQIRRYLSLQFLISFTTGVLVWLALEIIGVDFAVTWGALAFFLNFIPTVGSILSSIPPILLALVQFYPSIWPGCRLPFYRLSPSSWAWETPLHRS